MCDSGEELVGDFEEIEGDAVLTELHSVAKTPWRKNTDIRDSRSKSDSAATKRKSSEPTSTTTSRSSKAKRVDSERRSVSSRDSDRNLFSAVQEHGTLSTGDVVGEKVGDGTDFVEDVPQEELLALDARSSEALFERISDKLKPRVFGGYRTKVRVSPVVIADMGDFAMQRLLKSQQPNICFCFKGQAGKFRKKKGYADIHVEKDKDWYTLMHQLCQVKFAEKRVTLTVSIIKVSDNKLHAQGSFVLHLNRPEKIEKLIKAVKEEDSRPTNKACYLSLSEVPVDAPLLNLRHFFPFLPTYATDDCLPIKSKPGFKGPVRVCYRDLAQVEAVSDCFSDFTINGQTLQTRRCNQKKGEELVWSETDGSAGEDTATDDTGMDEGGRESASATDIKDEEESKEEEKEVEQEKEMEKEKEEEGKEEGGKEEDGDDDDDDISSMARDLCSDMRESLNKLKQMETDDPNIQKILEFQAQLAQLQKTLSKPGRKSAGASAESDPWTLSSADTTQEPERSPSPDKTPASVQEEMKALKEQEEKRRSNWAKKMIEDVKQHKPSGQETDKAAKLEAQKLLQAREDRLRQKKEEEEAERQRKAEEAERQKKAEEMEKKRQEKDLKEGIAQIVLPFQDEIKKETSGKSGAKREVESASTKSKPVVTQKETKREPEKVQMIWESIYLEKVNSGRLADLPANFKIRLRFYENRGCPVQGCPNKRYFKKTEEFASHWQIFHQENLTVRFCPKCSAYFANVAELEDHLRSRHSLSRSHVKDLLRNARQKVIRNPSYRDPGLYTLST